MRNSIAALILLVAVPSASAWLSRQEDGNASKPSLTFSGCANVRANDSAHTLATFREVVSGASQAVRTVADLPNLPKDSVRFAGTSFQCDSVVARYIAYEFARSGTTLPTNLRLVLLRVGPTRWVGDPHVSTKQDRDWIILDSTLTIIKVWRTTN